MASCHPEHQWYCSSSNQFYTGCCLINACNQTPGGCPASARLRGSVTSDSTTWTTTISISTSTSTFFITPLPTKLPITVTLPAWTSYSTSDSRPSSLPPASVTGHSDTSSQSFPPEFSAAAPETSSSGGIIIPVGALVGLVVGSGFLLAAGFILAYLRWARYRRKKNEGRDAANLPGDATAEQGPRGLPPRTTAASGPSALVDTAGVLLSQVNCARPGNQCFN